MCSPLAPDRPHPRQRPGRPNGRRGPDYQGRAALDIRIGPDGRWGGAAQPPPAPAVKVETVVERDVPISREYVGTLVGYINAQIRARVSGHLVSQKYTEGALVKSGDVLFQVDPRPFQTAVDQAE